MKDPVLRSRRDADSGLAALFRGYVDSAEAGLTLQLQVREDRCFKEDTWVSVGEVIVHPELPHASEDEGGDGEALLRAFRYGFFDWLLPAQNVLEMEICSALDLGENRDSRDKHAVGEAVKAIAHIAARCGLAYPTFDAMALARMPFSRPVSVVVDTGAVIQGGLDFLARHLTPAARIKVPALVHMEILNLTERYFSRRRRSDRGARYRSGRMLLDRVSSQGGQRVLLRLETDRGVEFERPRLGADPLRGVIQPDSDAEDRRLGLQEIQRSFADRLILETAIQHRAHVGSDHPVMLMTSDQGLARMGMVEGIEPIFIDSNAVSRQFATTLSGTTFRPFVRDDARLDSSAVTDVLWECAVAFGSARLIDTETRATFEVSSMGEGMAWSPYHSYEDLLWTKMAPASQRVPQARTTYPGPELPAFDRAQEAGRAGRRRAGTAPRESIQRSLTGAYSFNLGSMLNLVDSLERVELLRDEEGTAIARVKSESAYGQYCKFLASGRFAKIESGGLRRTERLSKLLGAMKELAYEDMKALLSDIPSFGEFLSKLKTGAAVNQEASGVRKVAFPTYCALSELCCAGVRFVGEGIYATPFNPAPDEFAQSALEGYHAVRAGEDFALTGEWLRWLVTRKGIHPVHTRQRLAEAHQGGYMTRFFEGSTPETRYENVNIQVLHLEGGAPAVRRINLYHGDFLLPGRAAVSVKLLPGGEA